MNVFTSIGRDLVHATRSLAKSRAFTFVCVVSLGIGLAPPIAIQYWARVFTTPPPHVNTADLVELVTTRVGPQKPTDHWSYPDFIDLRDAETGASIAGWALTDSEVALPSGGPTTDALTMFVSSNYFDTVDVALERGAGFPQTNDHAVILGYTFWQRRLNANPDILGKMLTLDGVPHVVAGIAPYGFVGHFLRQTELFVPLEWHPALRPDAKARFDRNREWVRIVGRLSPGVSVEQASTAVSAVTAQLAKAYPATNEFRSGIAAPYHPLGHFEGSDVPIMLTILHTITAIPLIVVCLNISGMVQVRSAMRERELSIRQAIGATRGRLMQHLLAEAVLLAAAGGTLASVVLFNLPPLVSWWAGEPIPAELEAALRVDVLMVAITAGLCLATSLLFGWLPALRFSRPAIMTVLKDEAGTGGIRTGRAHRLTAALQVSIAVPLLVLCAVSLERVRATAVADLGFAADLIYATPLDLAASSAANIDSRIRRASDALARADAVDAVTVADGLPLDFRYRLTRVSTEPEPGTLSRVVQAHVTRVGDGYLETMKIPLVRGRGFTIDDTAGAELVTVISQPLADLLFPNAESIGQRIIFGPLGDNDRPQKVLTVVGVTADFPTSQMSTEREQLLLPLAQHSNVVEDSVPVEDDRGGAIRLMLIARSAAGEPSDKLTAAFDSAMREINPDAGSTGQAGSSRPPGVEMVTGVQLRRNSMDDFLTQSAVAGTTAGIALLLAALGIYGVVGLMVTTRTREIAVRVTLGASRLRVMTMIVFEVVRLVAPGVVVGLIFAGALVRLNGGMLGVPLSGLEPLAYVVGAVIATLTAVLASLAPARRAASVQPMVAMRST